MGESRRFFEELYHREYDNIRMYVQRMVADSNGIEDIVQEIFLEAYRSRKKLMGHPNVAGWLRITAKNKIMKWEEKQRKYRVDCGYLLENSSAGRQNKPDEYRMVEVYSTVQKILSAEELELLRCYYEYGYSSQELAQRLGISESCFKVRILRMKQKLKNSLELPFVLCLGDFIVEMLRFWSRK